MSISQYIIDAFSDKVFKGNPAAVCRLNAWLPDSLMQSIAQENNLSETAFLLGSDGEYELRWFTPSSEIDLCGHATLASAYMLSITTDMHISKFSFHTKSGVIVVEKKGDWYAMDFPSFPLQKIAVSEAMCEAIGCPVLEAFMGRDLVCVLENATQVRTAKPNLDKIAALSGLLCHVTAQSESSIDTAVHTSGSITNNAYDCISRSFAPKLGVAEDPVCGSGHCHIAPLWASKLKKNEILAFQASKRGGVLACTMQGTRVLLAGQAALYAKGEIYI